MLTLTPTPEPSAVAVAAAVTLSLGARTVGGRLQSRFAARSALVRRWSYPGALALVAGYGAWTLGLPGRRLDATTVLAGVAVGLLAGWAALRFDRWVTRRALRELVREQPRPPGARSLPGRGDGAGHRRRGLARARSDVGAWSSSRRLTEHGVAGLVMIAVLEETIYRGVITEGAALAPSALLQLGLLAAGGLAFALTHAWFGPGQFAAKAGLALVTLLALLATGTLLAPIVAHVLVNVRAWDGWERLDARVRHVRPRRTRREPA